MDIPPWIFPPLSLSKVYEIQACITSKFLFYFNCCPYLSIQMRHVKSLTNYNLHLQQIQHALPCVQSLPLNRDYAPYRKELRYNNKTKTRLQHMNVWLQLSSTTHAISLRFAFLSVLICSCIFHLKIASSSFPFEHYRL